MTERSAEAGVSGLQKTRAPLYRVPLVRYDMARADGQFAGFSGRMAFPHKLRVM